MKRRLVGRATLTVLAMVLVACSSTTEQGTVGVQRSQLLLVSSAELDKAAAAEYQKVIQRESPKGTVNRDHRQTERVRGIAKRLIPQTAVFRKDAPEIRTWSRSPEEREAASRAAA